MAELGVGDVRSEGDCEGLLAGGSMAMFDMEILCKDRLLVCDLMVGRLGGGRKTLGLMSCGVKRQRAVAIKRSLF